MNIRDEKNRNELTEAVFADNVRLIAENAALQKQVATLTAQLTEARIGAPFRAGDRVVFIDGKQVGTFERYKDQSHVVVRWDNGMIGNVSSNGITLVPATTSASENGGDA